MYYFCAETVIGNLIMVCWIWGVELRGNVHITTYNMMKLFAVDEHFERKLADMEIDDPPETIRGEEPENPQMYRKRMIEGPSGELSPEPLSEGEAHFLRKMLLNYVRWYRRQTGKDLISNKDLDQLITKIHNYTMMPTGEEFSPMYMYI